MALGYHTLEKPAAHLRVSRGSSPFRHHHTLQSMASRILEEVLHDILKLCVFITPIHDVLLQSVGTWRWIPSDDLKMPPRDALLVSKRWPRVGTPLFYHTVFLHDACQVRELVEVLGDNPALGTHARNVCLEGGYARDMLAVLKHMPCIRSLAVSTAVSSSDSTTGLLRALPLRNPTRLYLQGSHERKSFTNKKST